MKTTMTLAKKPWFLGVLALLFASFALWNIPIEKRKYGLTTSALTTDYTGLLPEKIDRVVDVRDRQQLQRIVKEANERKQHISIAGLQHSQGGHTYYKDGIVLDMRGFDRVLEVNPKEKTVHVESGATWEDVQEAINPYGLALQVTQSQSIFTIGGSLSVNAHGRDIRFGPMANTVREMTILTPTGEIKHITRGHHEEWMKYILGGYGLFGIILDVTLDLTDNEVYKIHTEKLQAAQYEGYLEKVLNQPDVAMHYARVSVAPSSFLDEMYVIDYRRTNQANATDRLKGETGIRASKIALDIGRQGGKFEDFFWATQKTYIDSLKNQSITRNNAMRSESTFMEFTKPGKVEVLQEFFIPVHQYEAYMDDLKKLLPADDRNTDFKVHNITVRYALEDTQTSLSYAEEDMLGLVVLIQHGLQEEDIADARSILQNWTDITLKHNGTYYLPYYPYQTKQQFRKAYPNWEQFRAEKQQRDPNSVFVNQFYDHYIK